MPWTCDGGGICRRPGDVYGPLPGGYTPTEWHCDASQNPAVLCNDAQHMNFTQFTVPAAPSWLAFDYNTQTESDAPYWDQRWVQISVNGGRFENLRQLHGERMDAWLSSPWIDLSAYADQQVDLIFNTDASAPGRGGTPDHDEAIWGAPAVRLGR